MARSHLRKRGESGIGFPVRRKIADAINYFVSENPELAEAITARVAAHHEALGQAGIRINSPLLRYTGLALAGRQMVKTVRALFGLPAL